MRATEILIDLRKRLENAAVVLEAEAHTHAEGHHERTRLLGKAQGVCLALSYLHDYGTPLDEIATAPARSSDPSTSKAAAVAMSPGSAVRKLASVFYETYVTDALLGLGGRESEGMAAWEAVRIADLEAMKAPWKRVSELGEAGIIEPTGFTSVNPETGRKVQQLRLTAHGVAEVERLRAERMEVRS